MLRERALKVVMVLVGLLFIASIYPVVTSLRQPSQSDQGDTMMLSIYFTLGIFLLIAVRNPLANRSLIFFAAWSSFAHAAVMAAMAYRGANDRRGLLVAAIAFVIVGLPLLLLAPRPTASPSLQNP